MSEIHVKTCTDWTTFDFLVRPTKNSSISKICPKLQVLTSHFAKNAREKILCW